MSEKQWRKAQAAERINDGTWSLSQGAGALGLSERQMRRICARVESGGAAGVLHAGLGRKAHNGTDSTVVGRIVELMRGKYAGFNDTHACEKLAELEHIKVGRETLRRVLRHAGIGSPRKRRPKQVFRRRQPRSQEGMLLQWDGSSHHWLEGRGATMCLMGAVDDATGKLLKGAHFVSNESSAAYLRALHGLVSHHGVPWAIYMDRHSCLKRNDDHWTEQEELQGRQDLTQVGRALEELDIEPIYAMTPQAKGRVERMWGTLQDRLVSELRLAGACTIEHANRVLETFRLAYNRRFGRRAKDQTTAWRSAPDVGQIARICAFSVNRLIRKDHTVRYEGHIIDLNTKRGGCLAGERAELRHLLDGTLQIYVKGTKVYTGTLDPPVASPPQIKHVKKSVTDAHPPKKKTLTFAQIKAKRAAQKTPFVDSLLLKKAM